MSRGTALSSVRALLKAELRDTQETNSTQDTEYNYALSNKQRDFALAYDWPFLQHDWDLACAGGSRYLNIPTSDTRGVSVTINFERPVTVNNKLSSLWNETTYGIGIEQYNYLEGTANPQDPIRRWRMVTNTSEALNPDQVEIWPVPVTAQTLRFTGQRNVLTLTADADKADLDDLLLAYFVAADYLAFRGLENAPMALAKAQSHLIKLRSGYPTVTVPPVVFGRQPYTDRENIKLVAIR